MKHTVMASALAVGLASLAVTGAGKISPLLDRTMRNIDGKPVRLAKYQGKVLLIVNTASQCGHTPQYEGLESLYRKYKDRGFVVLGFPSNDFGGQEPGTNSEIKAFCKTKYAVTFPMFAKIKVTGAEADPLYKYLTEPPTAGKFAGPVQWNFTKFLVGRDGKVVARFASGVKPDAPELTTTLEAELASK
jgi:glutathione peroxidase